MPRPAHNGMLVPDELLATGLQRLYLRPRIKRFIMRRFHRMYWAHMTQTVYGTSWLGVPLAKYPGDVWVYQELLHDLRPDLIVECGTADGGSAWFLAGVCDLLGHGRIVTVDINDSPLRPEHPRITYLRGSSTDPAIVARIRDEAAGAERVLVILDSDHSDGHVLAELRAYADLVTPGSYLVAEDTALGGNPVDTKIPSYDPGPRAAVATFLRERDEFVPDPYCERFMMSQNPGGFLRRVR